MREHSHGNCWSKRTGRGIGELKETMTVGQRGVAVSVKEAAAAV